MRIVAFILMTAVLLPSVAAQDTGRFLFPVAGAEEDQAEKPAGQPLSGDEPATAAQASNKVADGASSERYAAVRKAAFARIDTALKINSSALLDRRLKQLNPDGDKDVADDEDDPDGPGAPGPGVANGSSPSPPNLQDIVTTVVRLDQVDNVLDLVVSGGKERLIAGIILDTLRQLTGAESADMEAQERTDAMAEFLSEPANKTALQRALTTIQQKQAQYDKLQETQAAEKARAKAELSEEINKQVREWDRQRQIREMNDAIRKAEEQLTKLKKEMSELQRRRP